MRLAVELSRQNVEHGAGGPFGAAIFERESGRLIAPGVNLVVNSGCSVFHAEMVADHGRPASSRRLRPRRGGKSLRVGCEHRALRHVPRRGGRSLLCGARGEDTEEIGFYEGTKPDRWVRSLEGRSIVVTRALLREEATSVRREYARCGGEIYNPRQDSGRLS